MEFLEMLIVASCPGQLLQLNAILKPRGREVFSYARHVDKFREGVQNSLHLVSW